MNSLKDAYHFYRLCLMAHTIYCLDEVSHIPLNFEEFCNTPQRYSTFDINKVYGEEHYGGAPANTSLSERYTLSLAERGILGIVKQQDSYTNDHIALKLNLRQLLNISRAATNRVAGVALRLIYSENLLFALCYLIIFAICYDHKYPKNRFTFNTPGKLSEEDIIIVDSIISKNYFRFSDFLNTRLLGKQNKLRTIHNESYCHFTLILGSIGPTPILFEYNAKIPPFDPALEMGLAMNASISRHDSFTERYSQAHAQDNACTTLFLNNARTQQQIVLDSASTIEEKLACMRLIHTQIQSDIDGWLTFVWGSQLHDLIERDYQALQESYATTDGQDELPEQLHEISPTLTVLSYKALQAQCDPERQTRFTRDQSALLFQHNYLMKLLHFDQYTRTKLSKEQHNSFNDRPEYLKMLFLFYKIVEVVSVVPSHAIELSADALLRGFNWCSSSAALQTGRTLEKLNNNRKFCLLMTLLFVSYYWLENNIDHLGDVLDDIFQDLHLNGNETNHLSDLEIPQHQLQHRLYLEALSRAFIADNEEDLELTEDKLQYPFTRAEITGRNPRLRPLLNQDTPEITIDIMATLFDASPEQEKTDCAIFSLEELQLVEKHTY